LSRPTLPRSPTGATEARRRGPEHHCHAPGILSPLRGRQPVMDEHEPERERMSEKDHMSHLETCRRGTPLQVPEPLTGG
jgi:hypothetical protein